MTIYSLVVLLSRFGSSLLFQTVVPNSLFFQSVVPNISNCCFLTCIQISLKASKVVWYSRLLKKFPQFVVIHTVKGFVIVNKAETDVFLELSCFSNDPTDFGNLISGSPIEAWLGEF